GMDLECAQCHDHPIISDYYQSDYYGIFAFVSRSYLFQPDKKKPAVIAEKAAGIVKFKSVFTEEEGTTRPRLPGGKQIDEPTFAKGEEYKVKPDPKKKNIRPIPKFSPRAELAKLATNGSNLAFNRNIANRLWAHMMGRGLVHPVDLHHVKNAAAHPELLEMLAADFVAMKFDVKRFVREVALSQTYQRSFRLPEGIDQELATVKQELAAAQTKFAECQQVVVQQTKSLEKIQADLAAAEKAAAPFAEQLVKLQGELAAAQKAVDEANKALVDAKNQLAEKQKVAKPVSEAVAKMLEAAKNLPADKELADLAAKMKAKSDKVAGEVVALEKAITEKTSAATTATEKFTSTTKSANETKANAEPARKQVESQRQQLDIAATTLSTAKKSVSNGQGQIDGINLFLVYAEKLANARPALDSIQRIETEVAAVRQAVGGNQQQAKKNADEMAKAQKTYDDAVKAAATAKAQLAKPQEELKVAVEALAKAKAALQQTPDDKAASEAAAAQKSRVEELTKALAELERAAAARESDVATVTQRRDALKKALDETNAALASNQEKLKTLELQLAEAIQKFSPDEPALEEASQSLAQHWTKKFSLASLDHLTPEQMAWSVMQATGLTDRQRTASTAELDKKTPLKPEEKNDPAKLAERAKQIDQAVFDKLKGNVAKFVALFGPGAGQPQHEFFATVDQALFFSNGGELRGWLAPGGGNLTDRLMKIDDPKALTEELYLSVLTRLPADDEAADVASYLSSRPKEKSAVVQEMVWALITSTEFRFNH
ncbi:MAG: DUF1553 domain-containing protein, partial [Planctomycetes bacterium]|nr:DUF1553 domain-containing protein [Planctomycetota bacterium]